MTEDDTARLKSSLFSRDVEIASMAVRYDSIYYCAYFYLMFLFLCSRYLCFFLGLFVCSFPDAFPILATFSFSFSLSPLHTLSLRSLSISLSLTLPHSHTLHMTHTLSLSLTHSLPHTHTLIYSHTLTPFLPHPHPQVRLEGLTTELQVCNVRVDEISDAHKYVREQNSHDNNLIGQH